MTQIKVGIFGDSFANAHHGHDDFPELSQAAWFKNLGSKYDVVSYGQSGASNYYSYKKFLAEQTKYDKIIFLVTYPGRHPASEINIPKESCFDFLGSGPGVDYENHKTIFASSAAGIQYLLKNFKFDTETKSKLKAFRDYYVFVANEEYDNKMTELLIQDIFRIRPDTIFINCAYKKFDVSQDELGKPLISEILGPTLDDFLDSMIRGIIKTKERLPHMLVSRYLEKRCVCHFTVETNLFLAECIRDSLESGVWNPSLSEKILHNNKGISYYYHTEKYWKSLLPGI